MANENNKEVANSLNKYNEYKNKGKNLILDIAEGINKWYAEQLNKITESDIDNSRIETGFDNEVQEKDENANNEKQISTKVKQYNELQTNKSDNKKIIKPNRIQTVAKEDTDIVDYNATLNKKLKRSKRISTIIKGTKMINNSTQKMIRDRKSVV